MKLLERIIIFWTLLGGLLLLAIMFVTAVNVGSFTLSKLLGLNIPSLPGYEDFISLVISSAVLMFFPYCQLHKGHICVEIFTNKLPLFICQALEKLWLFVFFLLALFFTYWMVLGMIETYQDQVLTPILGYPIWPSYILGIVSLGFWAVVSLSQVITKKNAR